MNTPFKLAVITVGLVTFTNVSAQQLGFNFNSPSSQDNGASFAVTGFRFQVTSSITIDGLAAFNPSAPGGIGGAAASGGGNIQVGLWNDSGTLLRSVAIPSGTTPISGTYFSSASISPITLEPGFYRVADNGYRTWVTGSSPSGFSGYSSLPGLTYVSSVFSESGLGFSFPNFTDTNYAFLNANVVSAIPEPSTYALLGGIATLAVALVRRQRRAGALIRWHHTVLTMTKPH